MVAVLPGHSFFRREMVSLLLYDGALRATVANFLTQLLTCLLEDSIYSILLSQPAPQGA
jgi:hypothetical protein